MKALGTLLATIAVVFWLTDAGSAYRASGRRWASGTVTMHLQQGSASGTLIDGSRDWNAVTEAALSAWKTWCCTRQAASRSGPAISSYFARPP